MTHIISIIGVSGIGKTSLVHALNTGNQFAIGLESHAERPFQASFKTDVQLALANQFDFLLYRAEQERLLRADPRPALVDGGLDLDFQGFTRLFHARGWLSEVEFELLERFYKFIRENLPPPELIIHLTAREDVIQSRLEKRDRINIASASDASLLAAFLDEWLISIPQKRILHIDVTNESADFSGCIPTILARIDAQLLSGPS